MEQYDSAANYFGQIANKAPNKYAERASIIAARLHYFNIKDYVAAEKYFKLVLAYTTQQEQKNEAIKGLLRCQYKLEKWTEAAATAELILQEKGSSADDIIMSNMAIYQQSLIQKDTSKALAILQTVIKSNSSVYTEIQFS